MQLSYRSLRLRLLVPILATAMLAALLVSAASYFLGNRWADEQLRDRFTGIQKTIADSRFPLNGRVLDLLAELTRTELIAFDENEKIRYSTVGMGSEQEQVVEARKTSGAKQISLAIDMTNGDAEKKYRLLTFSTVGGASRPDRVASIAVLFDEAHFEATRRRASVLALATGLSTIFALSSITLFLTSRLVGRIRKLQRRVEKVADGDFTSTVSDHIGDEIGQLGQAVDSMAGQLDTLWKRIHSQHREKLLHKIASGMAHQLRNSLTGARMAVELHAADCNSSDDEGIRVAIRQIELSEDYVRRLLLAQSGKQDKDRPARVMICFEDIRMSLSPIVQHLRVEMDWHIGDSVEDVVISDGPSWTAAVTNLIDNAIHASREVSVLLEKIEGDPTTGAVPLLRVVVSDRGPGIDQSIAAELFEPFVTSKPEGMGLGLSVVHRTAERFGGQVRFRRKGERTIFELDVPIVDEAGEKTE
ncbi:Sensor protein BasS [Novipirellula aureliae]|uniref:histidine kinase n=1 Tax=Novipirellula aureliae TaxID=2527966 RepID=A0A5C6DTV7_9BACT|nr:HAMP domain-containing sensor histidine kinase [Novipirellula aureliae]TWU38941.1 Sensor protein BasS [Novipirellula aureliae]